MNKWIRVNNTSAIIVIKITESLGRGSVNSTFQKDLGGLGIPVKLPEIKQKYILNIVLI